MIDRELTTSLIEKHGYKSVDVIKNIPKYEGAGVYAFIGTNNNLLYIGSSVNVFSRLKAHDNAISHGRYVSKSFRNKIKNQYRFDALVLEVFSSKCSLKSVRERELTNIELYSCLSGFELLNFTDNIKHNRSYLDNRIDRIISSLETLRRNYRANKKAISSTIECTENILRRDMVELLEKIDPICEYKKEHKHLHKHNKRTYADSWM